MVARWCHRHIRCGLAIQSHCVGSREISRPLLDQLYLRLRYCHSASRLRRNGTGGARQDGGDQNPGENCTEAAKPHHRSATPRQARKCKPRTPGRILPRKPHGPAQPEHLTPRGRHKATSHRRTHRTNDAFARELFFPYFIFANFHGSGDRRRVIANILRKRSPYVFASNSGSYPLPNRSCCISQET